VVYGIVGLKTHCKSPWSCDPKAHTVRYVHIGTGNYNDKTARVYEDFGLLTSDPAIATTWASSLNFLRVCRDGNSRN